MNGLAQLKIIASSLVLFVVVVCSNAAFSIANLEKPYAEALLARYEYLLVQLQDQIQRQHALHGGVPQHEMERAVGATQAHGHAIAF